MIAGLFPSPKGAGATARAQWEAPVRLPAGRQELVLFKVNPRAKRFILRLDPKTLRAKVTVPQGANRDVALRFVERHADWLETQLGKHAPGANGQRQNTLAPGQQLPWNGDTLVLDHQGAERRVHMADGVLHIPANRDLRQAVGRFVRDQALCDMKPRLTHYAARLARLRPDANTLNRIRITDTKSRWGSCSSRGTISVSLRLMMAPPWIRDYVCAHEVAHLAQPDHSAAFWALCATLEPNAPADKARTFLRTHGPRYFAVPLP